MPLITQGNAQVVYAVVSILLRSDNTALISLRKVAVFADGQQWDFGTTSHEMSATDAAAVLDVAPVPGLTRRVDIEQAVISFFVASGILPAGGTVS